MLSENQMYTALIEKNSSFEGVFFAAIKTTGIFCKPTCTAKKPKQENVEYFSNSKDAILNGYRPCKICTPLEKKGSTPQFIEELLSDLNKNPLIKFKDYDLRQKKLDPNVIRKWFLKNHGMTFHAFQRMIRINSAFKKIKEGSTVSDVAFESGYQSLSGFSDSYKSIVGSSPKNSINKNIIYLMRIETPIGPMFAGATDSALCLLEFTDRKMLETEFKILSKFLKANFLQTSNKIIEQTKTQLDEYFSGKRKIFNIPLLLVGTDFQKHVWHILQTIEYGTTRSYKDQALAINNPEAVRAVANANGLNKMSIVIPCHRIIGSNGELTGYGGGLWRKKYLLDLENKNKNNLS